MIKKVICLILIITFFQNTVSTYCAENVNPCEKNINILNNLYDSIYEYSKVGRLKLDIDRNVMNVYYGMEGMDIFGNIWGVQYEEYCVGLRRKIINQSGRIKNGTVIDYSKIILLLTLWKQNPENLGGYNLLGHLGDFEEVTKYGVEGVVWTLLALDCHHYETPQKGTTRESLVEYLLKHVKVTEKAAQNNIYNICLSIQALHPYQNDPRVKEWIDEAVNLLSELYINNSQMISKQKGETIAQLIIALSTLGIDVGKDTRFINDTGTSLFHHFLGYQRNEPDVGFVSWPHGVITDSTTEQCAGALVAYGRFLKMLDGEELENWQLYHLDFIEFSERKEKVLSANEYHKLTMDSDLANHWSLPYFVYLIERGIQEPSISNQYQPNEFVTRAEFIQMISSITTFEKRITPIFRDVKEEDWNYDIIGGYVNKYLDNQYNHDEQLVKKYFNGYFRPNDFVTREEAAFFMVRKPNVKDKMEGYQYCISSYDDYSEIDVKYRESLAFCVDAKLMVGTNQLIHPKDLLTRGEAMVFIKKSYEAPKILSDI